MGDTVFEGYFISQRCFSTFFEKNESSSRHKKTPLCYTCCSTTNTRKAQRCKTIILQKPNKRRKIK
ncbi:hypothetical protein B4W83_08490 [Streptococcus pseudopneumoniae ATCC BAA-960 = CCUG 49455]|nr:hypothetical protein B4W83_08490 [Streptococcus pseudopneumoniae ATCC BAA-960 = CCUG 49455]